MNRITNNTKHIGIILAVIFAIIAFAWNYGVKVPMIQPDEGSILTGAAAIAGYSNDFASNTKKGYSLIISPAFLLVSSPTAIWMLVKAINSLLLLLTVYSLWNISYFFAPQIDLEKRLGSVIITSAYPFWIVFVGYSFAQIAFVSLYTFSVYLFFLALKRKIYFSILLGFIIGFLYWIHPTSIVVLIGFTITLIIYFVQNKFFNKLIALILSCLIIILLHEFVFIPFINHNMDISGQGVYTFYSGLSAFSLLRELFTIKGITSFLGIMSGQLFYFIIGTCGMIFISVKVIYFSFKQSHKLKLDDTQIVYLFIILNFIGLIILSSLHMSRHPDRLDHYMYGRYVEAILAPILLIGILHYSSNRKTLLLALPFLVFISFIFSQRMDSYSNIAYFNISAFWQVFYFLKEGIWIWLLSGLIIILILAYSSQRFGFLVLLLVFTFSSYKQIEWHKRNSNYVIEIRWALALSIRDNYSSRIDFDFSSIKNYVNSVYWYDYGFSLYDYKLTRMNPEKWYETSNGLFLSWNDTIDEQNNDIIKIVRRKYAPNLYVKKSSLSNQDLLKLVLDLDCHNWDNNILKVSNLTPTQIGKLQEIDKSEFKLISEVEKPGFLQFGPYIELPPGSFSVEFDMETALSNNTIGKIDVATKGGSVILAQKEITGSGKREAIEISFKLQETTDSIEFRVQSYGNSEIGLFSTKILINN